MFRLNPSMIAIFALTSVGCDDNVSNNSSSESKAVEVQRGVPESFSQALDALDAMSSEEDREAYRNDKVDMGLVHRQVGMRLRNDWGLWSGSKLRDYFSERGIAHADWISSAIFEAWIERLKTGSFDEDAIIAKYAKIEKDWRAWSENPDSYTQAEDDPLDPFAKKPAEQVDTGQNATRRESKPEGGDEPQPETEGSPR
jgi:hypothetical protein